MIPINMTIGKCLLPLLVNMSNPLTPVDKLIIKNATKTCKTRYKTCTKSITKKSNLNYWVICGGK